VPKGAASPLPASPKSLALSLFVAQPPTRRRNDTHTAPIFSPCAAHTTPAPDHQSLPRSLPHLAVLQKPGNNQHLFRLKNHWPDWALPSLSSSWKVRTKCEANPWQPLLTTRVTFSAHCAPIGTNREFGRTIPPPPWFPFRARWVLPLFSYALSEGRLSYYGMVGSWAFYQRQAHSWGVRASIPTPSLPPPPPLLCRVVGCPHPPMTTPEGNLN
jgi:hypothetical protein